MKIELVKVNEAKQHPIHQKTNLDPGEKDLTSLRESIPNGKLLPIVYIVILEGDVQQLYVVDGWSSVVVARELGLETLPGTELKVDDQEQLPFLLAELHSNYHSSVREDFKRFSYYEQLLSKGRGFRSDLQ